MLALPGRPQAIPEAMLWNWHIDWHAITPSFGTAPRGVIDTTGILKCAGERAGPPGADVNGGSPRGGYLNPGDDRQSIPLGWEQERSRQQRGSDAGRGEPRPPDRWYNSSSQWAGVQDRDGGRDGIAKSDRSAQSGFSASPSRAWPEQGSGQDAGYSDRGSSADEIVYSDEDSYRDADTDAEPWRNGGQASQYAVDTETHDALVASEQWRQQPRGRDQRDGSANQEWGAPRVSDGRDDTWR